MLCPIQLTYSLLEQSGTLLVCYSKPDIIKAATPRHMDDHFLYHRQFKAIGRNLAKMRVCQDFYVMILKRRPNKLKDSKV